MGKILCFGELLLRFSPETDGHWLKNHQMPVYLGGAELNVATALANWSLPVAYCTVLPPHDLSKDIIASLQERHIHTGKTIFSGDRIGCYYLTQGSDMKNQSVIYDRGHSAFGELKTGMINWDYILQDVSWFHFSAISPALNESVASVCLEALKAASKRNITISIDLNHRPILWKNRNPHDVMSILMPFCDVVMGNIWSAHDLLGVPLDTRRITLGDRASFLEQAHQSSIGIMKRFARVKTVACTFRFDKGFRGITYYADLYTEHHWVHSAIFSSDHIEDKVGSGDCFMAGLIYGIIKQLKEEEIIQFAASAGFGKFFEKGDSTNQDMKTILARIQQYV